MRLLEFLQIIDCREKWLFFLKEPFFSIYCEIKNRNMQRYLALLADILYDKMCVKS